MTETAASSRIPEFASDAEAAAFWDTHSSLDFPDEFEEVEVHIDRSGRRNITVRLNSDELAQLESLAAEASVPATMLVRRWIRQHLHERESN